MGQWYSLAAVVRSNTDRESYIDGAAEGTSTTSKGNASEDRVSVGRLGSSSPGSYFDGEIATNATNPIFKVS